MSLSLSGVVPHGGATYGGAVRSSAALRAQLAQCRKQLSDCVNCSSSSTREGQKQIQTLTSRIANLEAQIADTASAQVARPQQPAPAPAPAVAGSAAAASGRLLDVYA